MLVKIFFFANFYKGDKFCDCLFGFRHSKSLPDRVYSKRKEFAPHGSKFFPFKVDPFQKAVKKKNVSVTSLS